MSHPENEPRVQYYQWIISKEQKDEGVMPLNLT